MDGGKGVGGMIVGVMEEGGRVNFPHMKPTPHPHLPTPTHTTPTSTHTYPYLTHTLHIDPHPPLPHPHLPITHPHPPTQHPQPPTPTPFKDKLLHYTQPSMCCPLVAEGAIQKYLTHTLYFNHSLDLLNDLQT